MIRTCEGCGFYDGAGKGYVTSVPCAACGGAHDLCDRWCRARGLLLGADGALVACPEAYRVAVAAMGDWW